jgi:hypothetical protein
VAVETHDSLLIFSSEVLDLGLEQEVVDVEGDVGDGENEDLDSEQEDLARDELCGLQCGRVDKENSLRTVHSNSQVLYTNTGWSVHCFRAGSNTCHR